MKIKVSNTTNIQLDWLVAKCEGEDYSPVTTFNGIGMEFPATKYSTDWSQGGPILEREEIAAKPSYRDGAILMWEADSNKLNDDEGMEKYGPTPLVAALRCYVSSRLGDEVEVPDELGEQS